MVHLEDDTTLRIWTSSKAVEVTHLRRISDETPIWKAYFLTAENPSLARLYHSRTGWDIVGLIGLMRGEITKMMTLDLRDPALRAELGLSTVSIPSQERKRQEKRSAEQAMQLILEFVRDNPNCTRLEIARAIGRAKTPYLLLQIEQMVQAGALARTHIIRPNGVIEWRYFFAGDNEN